MKINLKPLDLKHIPEIKCDREQISHAMINIIINSLEAMKEGGNLDISSKLSPNKEWAKVTIRDDGTGFDESLKFKIFEPLFTTKNYGTGIGLSISRKNNRKVTWWENRSKVSQRRGNNILHLSSQ